MAGLNKDYILNRREATAYDFNDQAITEGDMTIEQAMAEGVWKVNCSQQIGIATATEVGLVPERWPIRVVLCEEKDAYRHIHVVAHYWQVVDAAARPLIYQRKAISSDAALLMYYKLIPELDNLLWNNVRECAEKNEIRPFEADMAMLLDQVYANASLVAPTVDQQMFIINGVMKLLEHSNDNKNVMRLKITDAHYLVAKVHGKQLPKVGALTDDGKVTAESLCCIKINHDRLKLRYDSISAGAVTLAAYSVASMFRYGLQESYEHKEYYTVYVKPLGTDLKKFEIHAIDIPHGAPAAERLAIGNIIDITSVKVNRKYLEIAPGLVVASGLNHYMFNHTTGGTVASGALLSVLAMHKIMHKTHDIGMLETITSLFYECLHPSNKRAIANLFFKSAKVATHGRCASSNKYEEFNPDSFLSIRLNPQPAGSHKAFIVATILTRVIDAGLAPFLPWGGQLDECVALCKDVLTNGARSHMGSNYYTGNAPIIQPASLDNYLPELAAYVQTMAKNDTLAMSPHLSREVVARANNNWVQMLKDLKGKDVSNVPAETVRQFLVSSGNIFLSFDPEKPETFAVAQDAAKVAKSTIRSILS